MAPAKQADELSFEEMWDEAHDKFYEATKKGLKGRLSLDDALSKLTNRFNPKDPKDGEKQEKIRGYATDVINFIQLLGGLAAQGASMVFCPAAMCFNAFQAILDIPGKIFRLHDHLALLFGEISTFLKQFQIYKRIGQITTLGIEFRRSVHELMLAFVDVAAMCVKFCDRPTLLVFKQMSKLVLFDNDSGVSDALENFRRLSKQHADIQDATTLERVVQAQHEAEGSHRMIWNKLNESAEANNEMFQRFEKSLDTLVEDAKERHHGEARQKVLQSLGKKLGISDNKKQNALLQLRSKALQGSGAWLQDLDTYQKWSALTTNDDPLLLLSGRPGSGRSMLFSTICYHVENKYRQEQCKQLKCCIANHAFEISEKESSQTGGSSSSIANTKLRQSMQAINSAAMQFSENSASFAKSLDAKEILIRRDITIEQQYTTVFASTDPSDAKETPLETFYILFLEDIDRIPMDEAKELVRAMLQRKVPHLKIAISGSEECINQLLSAQSFGDRALPHIRIEEYNEPDIKMYIEAELNNGNSFQSNTSDVREVVRQIRDKLPSIVHGCFSNVDIIINTVRSALESERNMEHVLGLISEKTLDRTDELCKNIMREMRHSLSDPEIDQLNELLIWTIYGVRYFQIDQMRALMFLLMQKSMFQDLEVKVKEKFSKLLKIDEEGDFVMLDWNMAQYFRDLPRIKQTDDEAGASDEPLISMQITIKNAKISQVQRFCWDLGEMAVLEKLKPFTFEKAVASGEIEKPIGVNETDGDLIILNKCFDLLLNEPNEQTRALGDYATTCVLWHLPRFQTEEERSRLAASERHEIVSQVISLLTQNLDALDAHLTPTFCTRQGLLDDEPLQQLRAFLLDPKATAKLRYKQRSWADKVTATNIVLVLEGVAKLIARRWLCETEWDPEVPYAWLAIYLGRLENPPPSGNSDGDRGGDVQSATVPGVLKTTEGTDESPNEGGSLTPGDPSEDTFKITKAVSDPVLQAAEWAEQAAGIEKKDALWYERLGRTYYAQQHGWNGDQDSQVLMRSCARTAFISAKTFDDHSWYASYCLAKLSSISNELEDAIKEMDVALSKLRLIENRTENEQRNLLDGLTSSAGWQTQLKQFDEAARRYQEVIALTPNSSDGRYDLFKLYYDTEQKSDALDLLKKLGGQAKSESELTELCALFLELCSRMESLEHVETIFAAAQGSDVFDLILETLETAQMSLQNNSPDANKTTGQDTLALRLSQSVALAHYTGIDSHIELALAHLKECIQHGFTSRRPLDYSSIPLLASLNFIPLYFARANSKQSTAIEDVNPISEIKSIMGEACKDGRDGCSIRFTLAGYYRLADQRKEAEKLLMIDVQTAFGLLSDADPDNDSYAYGLLGRVLMRTDDYLNALTAISLIGPPERYILAQPKENLPADPPESVEKNENLEKTTLAQAEIAEPQILDSLSGYSCNGKCKKDGWTWSTSVWYCVVCDDTHFCRDCLDMLRAGTLRCRTCSPDHDWLLVPGSATEFRASGKGKVRVGGELPPPDGPLQDGHRVGGEIVQVEEWLDTIRAKFGIEKKADGEITPISVA